MKNLSAITAFLAGGAASVGETLPVEGGGGWGASAAFPDMTGLTLLPE